MRPDPTARQSCHTLTLWDHVLCFLVLLTLSGLGAWAFCQVDVVQRTLNKVMP